MIYTLLQEPNHWPVPVQIRTFIRTGMPKIQFLTHRLKPPLKDSLIKILFALNKLKIKTKFKQFYIEFSIPVYTLEYLSSSNYLLPTLLSILQDLKFISIDKNNHIIASGNINFNELLTIERSKTDLTQYIYLFKNLLPVKTYQIQSQKIEKHMKIKQIYPYSNNKLNSLPSKTLHIIQSTSLDYKKVLESTTKSSTPFKQSLKFSNELFNTSDIYGFINLQDILNAPDYFAMPSLLHHLKFYIESLNSLTKSEFLILLDLLSKQKVSNIHIFSHFCNCGKRFNNKYICSCTPQTIRKTNDRLNKIASFVDTIEIHANTTKTISHKNLREILSF